MDFIPLISGARHVALSGAAAIEFLLNKFNVDFQPRGTAINNDTDAIAMRFAPGRNPKNVAKTIVHVAVPKNDLM
jgi:hypothetical protein